MDKLENTLRNWSKRSSDSENQKSENATKMIRKAIDASPKLSSRNIQIIPKGSYHNNTNVRLNSDVDVAVKLTDVFYPKYPEGANAKTFGHTDGNYPFHTYRQEVEEAVINTFGRGNVDFGDKSIKVQSNSYRVDADVVPCIEYRRYNSSQNYISGTKFFGKQSDESVVNFPEQHYLNGVRKNNNTSRRYKRVVRILKRLKYKMLDENYDVENISSFLIESLVFNVPNNYFNNDRISKDVSNALEYLLANTEKRENCKHWGEVSELLYLFHSGRKYSLEETHDFLKAAYDYLFVQKKLS
ncbi:nucleotidyltransferase [Marinococcus sp. PL1-022]|uniref:nucleotidyltransferase domain-containing protein n=1 Tax=Marinococcus sp. PL1-022 TaxID=3095363 RepID=UPI0029C29115|nr:nucleotidyltransferase [Marinococcus sp. PL1-022]MDX6154467.1 nucleotidyltransferase [Marinococcus sp. PL1-022]